MPEYKIGTFSYPDRARVLGAVDEMVQSLGPVKSDLSSTGSTEIIVRVNFPHEPMGKFQPEPEA